RTVLESAISLATVGETETGLLERLTSSFHERYGAESPLLGGILSGRRTLEVVGNATAKKLDSREPVILDLQTRVDGYWARAGDGLCPDCRQLRESVNEPSLFGMLRRWQG